MKRGEKETSWTVLFPPLLIPLGSTMEAKKGFSTLCHYDFVGNASNPPLKRRERERLFSGRESLLLSQSQLSNRRHKILVKKMNKIKQPCELWF